MRIGFFCNMANNFFTIVRYLRDRGEDAWLLRFEREDEHFRPEADSLSPGPEPFVRGLPWGRKEHLLSASKEELRAVLDEFDVLVGCGIALAYFAKAGRKADIMIPYGGDVTELPFVPRPSLTKPWKWWRDVRVSRLQWKAIHDAPAVVAEFKLMGPAFDALKYKGQRFNFYVPLVYDYTRQLQENRTILQSDFVRKFNEVRNEADFLVFHHSRHIWKTIEQENSDKGNDKLIKGFAQFLKDPRHSNSKLMLFEYGPDVDESKSLISDLGIEENVCWLPVSMRKEILYGIINSDVATGQFGTPCLYNGVTQEALTCGKALIHWRSREEQDLYPVMDASTPEQIADALTTLFRDPALRAEMGQKAKQWYHARIAEPFFRDFTELLHTSANAHK